jgi:glyoxylase-like metal-dependent hydrolase (beta-lactamase superfamily II)
VTAHDGAAAEAKLREVLPGIHLLHLPLPMKPTIVNVYLIDGGDEWALVDTGMNSADSIATFREALAQLGIAPGRVRKIICTHHHPDHFGTSKAYKAETGATLYLHRAEWERSQTFLPSDRPAEAVRFFLAHGIPLQRFANVPRPSDIWGGLYVTTAPDVFLNDGDEIAVGRRRIQIVWTPGHAPGHCVLYLPAERAMIVGDHLLPKITPHVGFAPGSTGNPLADFLDSQRKVQHFDVGLVLPAHGGVFPDHRHRANQIIQHHEARLRDIADIARRQPHTAYDVARRAFGFDSDSPLTYQFPATFETLAHLEYLRQAGTVTTDTGDDGQVLWRAA